MNTETYEKLLSELGIPSEWSAEDKESVLDEKYFEALELLDVAQQNGEEDRITQLDDRIRKIEDALEYAKEMKKRLSSGLVLNTQSEKDRLDELKEAGKKEETQTVKQLETTSQPAANTPIPQPSVSSNNANPLLRRARMELKDENWLLAARLYNDILNAEPENAEANLGLFMANQRIREKKDIPEAARDAMKDNRDIFQDKQYQRTLRYADDSLRKELESCEKGRNYLIAIEELQRAKSNEDYQRVSEMFDRLGDFADAGKKKEECDEYWKKWLYSSALNAMGNAQSLDECFEVSSNLGKLGDYKDAQSKKEEFDELWKAQIYADAMQKIVVPQPIEVMKSLIDCFDKLGDYKDSCEQKKSVKYNLASIYMNSISDYNTAKDIFEGLGEYSDSKDKVKECEEKAKLLERQKEEEQRKQNLYEEYKQKYTEFSKQIETDPKIQQHRKAIYKERELLEHYTERLNKNGRFSTLFLILVIIGLMAVVGSGIFLLTDDNDVTIIGELIITCIVAFIMLIVNIKEMNCGIFLGIFLTFFEIIPLAIVFFAILLGLDILPQVVLLVGGVLLLIAIVKRVKEVKYVNEIKDKIGSINRRISEKYSEINEIIGTEYHKIYDEYADVGAKRKSIYEVQRILI